MPIAANVCEAEIERIARHIARAERAARRRPPARLDPLRQLVRRLLLDQLALYRRARRFPLNRDFAERAPYFVDGDGTRCAMAHLLELGGEADLVARVARRRNHAWVRELADEPRLVAWLAAAGLTLAEAEAIQPSYDFCMPYTNCICSGGGYPWYPVPASGVVSGLIIAAPPQSAARVQIDSVDGNTQGLNVGDQVFAFAANGAKPMLGVRMLLPVSANDYALSAKADAGTMPLDGVVLDGNDNYQCGGGSPSLARAQFVAAVESSNCASTLASFNPAWKGGPHCGNSGCAVGDGSPSPLGILIALVSATAGRRLARRWRRPRAGR